MAEQSSSDTSTTDTDSDDIVKIPKTQFMLAVSKIRLQKRQLVAASNLHRLMREKEEELVASKEQIRQMQLLQQQSDTRFNNLYRLQAAVAAPSLPAATHSLEEDDACISSPEHLLPRSDGSVVRKSSREFSLPCSDVEADGELFVKPGNLPVVKDTAKSMNKQTMLESGTSISTSVPSPSLLVTSSSANLSSTAIDTCLTHVTCLSSSVTASPLPLPSVMSSHLPESKDLLDKVLQQNARLKKTLRDLLSQKGLSVSTYLVCYPAVTN